MEVLTNDNLNSIPELPEDSNIFCYSGFFINKKEEELHDWLGKEFSRISDIKSTKKKNTTYNLLNIIKGYIETKRSHIYNFQYFINNNDQYFYILNDKLIKILTKYLTKDIKIVKDFNFNLNYWKDLYFNDNFINVYKLEKNDKFSHYSFTDTKYEQKDSFPHDLFSENNQKWKVEFFIMTKDNKKSKIMEKIVSLGPFVELEKGDNIHNQLKNTFNQICYNKQIDLLNKQWSEMELKSDFYVFGNDILKAIKNYEIKEVYCYKEFKAKIEKNMDKDCLNFKWYLFDNNKNENNSDLLKLKDYKGIFAKRYYV